MLESRMAKLETDVAVIKNDGQHTRERIDSIETKIDAFISSADAKYADKTVERIVYGMVAIILTAVVGSIIALILK